MGSHKGTVNNWLVLVYLLVHVVVKALAAMYNVGHFWKQWARYIPYKIISEVGGGALFTICSPHPPFASHTTDLACVPTACYKFNMCWYVAIIGRKLGCIFLYKSIKQSLYCLVAQFKRPIVEVGLK